MFRRLVRRIVLFCVQPSLFEDRVKLASWCGTVAGSIGRRRDGTDCRGDRPGVGRDGTSWNAARGRLLFLFPRVFAYVRELI